MQPKRKKLKDKDFKKKGKAVLNVIEIELLEFKQADSKLSLIVRKSKIATKTDLKMG